MHWKWDIGKMTCGSEPPDRTLERVANVNDNKVAGGGRGVAASGRQHVVELFGRQVNPVVREGRVGGWLGVGAGVRVWCEW
jgi:hypothetical protein